MEQLLEKGVRFGAVTVEELMEEAGMARATFYTHFRDRGELVMRLMRLVVEELAESTGTWIADAKNAHRADMEAALFGMVQTFKKHQAVLAAITDMAPSDQGVSDLYEQMMEALCIKARRSLRAVKREGRSRPDASDDVAEIMTRMVTMYCVRYVGERDGKALDKLSKSLGYICASVAFADNEEPKT